MERRWKVKRKANNEECVDLSKQKKRSIVNILSVDGFCRYLVSMRSTTTARNAHVSHKQNELEANQ